MCLPSVARLTAGYPTKLVQQAGAVVFKEGIEMSAPAGAFSRLRAAGDHTPVTRS